MRILQISEHVWPVGGCERMLRDTCDLLRAAGHEVTVLVAEDSPVQHFDHPVERLPRSWGPRVGRRLLPQLDALLARVRPDVAHIHNAQDFASATVVDHLARAVPTMRYVHDARLVCPQLRSKWLMKQDRLCSYPMGWRCLANCWPVDAGGGYHRTPKHLVQLWNDLRAARRLAMVAVGSGYMRELLGANGFDAARVQVLGGFTARAAGVAPAAPAHRHVLAVGRFDSAKGLGRLPAVLAALQCHDWRATLVGDGEGLQAARDDAARLGIAARVEFVPQAPPALIDDLYRDAGVVVMPSRVPEAFGLVGIEAMAFGRPVVAYDIGGVREWLQPGVTGTLVAPGDEAGLTAALDLLLADAALRQRLGAAGREAVDRRFRPQQHLQALLALYDRLRGQAPGGPGR